MPENIRSSILVADNLGVRFPDGTEALRSISFKAEPGEIIAVIGRSGAGKSTLLRCINGMQSYTRGELRIENAEVKTLSEYDMRCLRANIGFIWQEHNLILRLSTMTNVLTGRLCRNEAWKSSLGFFGQQHREVAIRNLDRLNLLQRASLRADKLSGGEKQRAAIARAMTQEPKLLLADEPVASLDPELAWKVMADLARIAREDGVLTLINLHQVELAKEFADRIIGIAQGEIAYDGPPQRMTKQHLDRIYRFDQTSVAAVM